MFIIIVVSLLLGIFSGTLAGFFGIGGGIILVPFLTLCFTYLKLPNEIIMHMSIGTSLACILVTAMSSVYTHHKNQNVDWAIFNKLLIGIIIGTALGTISASKLSSHHLELFFTVFLFLIFLKMLFQSNSQKSLKNIHTIIYWFVGSLIGFKSAILGVGGGTISIPFLTWSGLQISRAVGISASIGLPIALVGSLSNIYLGLGVKELPPYSLGYIYLPVFCGIIMTSSFFARFGAMLSQKVSQKTTRILFLIFLGLICMKNIISLMK